MDADADHVTLPALDYRAANDDARPRWATRLGIASVALGTIGLFAGRLRLRDAWRNAYDPTFRWLVPPPAWVPPVYVGVVVAAITLSALLLAAGVVTLRRPVVGARWLRTYAWMKLVLVALTAACRATMLAVAPRTTTDVWLIEAAIECVVFGAFPLLVLIVLRRTRAASSRA